MWYNKVRPIPVNPPRRGQRIVIRTMILVGLAAMALFFLEITKEEYIGFKPLYYPLLFALLYMGLRILYEWYHYWDMSVPETIPLQQDYKVDIFTTFVPGEPYDMLLKTLEAIQEIKYPHTTYLCDEGDDPYLKEQCERLGIVHVYRGPIKTNAKAGNINYAIENFATGDICLILDPDHIPAPDFFDWVLPHFQNEEVGFVQVVQAYSNIYENLIAKASAQQTFQFYGPIMMTMNSYGTAQAIGANCTFRRKALDSIGGHAPGLAEDMHTSMLLHAEGWKSAYVPRVLSRGLVPSTLSAYYMQQLKWSRGVFELLVTTYPRIFGKLNWRQRLHYGLLPWHYFMGFLFLINFLVPIISLFTSYIPMQVGLAYFLSYAAPLLISIIVIRHYVQKWVMEEDERGFHIQGGLIAIGTWWIHALGFIYTILRRKVPYNPTPKDGKEENTWGLNIPNLAMGGLTLTAIIYGLWRDLNPYSLIMAGFASLNLLFIGFNFFASMQNRWRAYKARVPWLDWLFIQIWKVKDAFWRLRHGSYQFVRIIAFPVALLLGVFLWYTTSQRDITQIRIQRDNPKVAQHFIAENESDISKVRYQNFRFQTPIYDVERFMLSCSGQEQYPYIQWTTGAESPSAEAWAQKVLAGDLDTTFLNWAHTIRLYGKPVFLAPFPKVMRLKPETETALWKYLNNFFNIEGINNLMLVYQTAEPHHLQKAFPDAYMIDFIAIDYQSLLKFERPEDSLNTLLVQTAFKNETPWLLQFEQAANKQELRWLDSLSGVYPDLSGVVYTGNGPFVLSKDFSFKNFTDTHIPKPQKIQFKYKEPAAKSAYYSSLPLATNYLKGLEWENTQHPLFRRVIEADFQEMKELGIRHINRYGPSLYDPNLFKEAQDEGLSISYSFYIGNQRSFAPDAAGIKDLENLILKQVEDYKDEESIVAWHLGGPAFNQLEQYYHPPQLLYEKEHLINWLDQLSEKMKALDSTRPISAELDFSVDIIEQARSIFTAVSGLDGIGVNIGDQDLELEDLKSRMAACKSPLFIQSVGPELGAELAKAGFPVCFSSWQDDVFASTVALDGLKTLKGYKKKGYASLERILKEEKQLPLSDIEDFKIIPQARAVFAGQYQSYLCLVKKNGKWQSLAGQDVQIDWHLIKLDEFGSPALIKEMFQKGPFIHMELPAEEYRYRLLAYLVVDGYAIGAQSNLLTPLYFGPELHSPTREELEYQRKKSL